MDSLSRKDINTPMNLHSRLERNNQYYDKFTAKVKDRTQKRNYTNHMDKFSSYLPTSATVLDIGCGLGQHMEIFQKCGYKTLGIEPSSTMRKQAQSKGLNVFKGSFENLNQIKLPSIDGVWTAASLLHVPLDEIPTVCAQIAQLLNINCPWFITVRTGEGASWDHYDASESEVQRFIQLFEPEMLQQQLQTAGFEIVYQQLEQSTWGRPCQWLSLIALQKKECD